MQSESPDDLPLAGLIARQRQTMFLSLAAVARRMQKAAAEEGTYSLASRQTIHG